MLNGRYKGIKLAEVRADLHNGIILQSNRDYRLYIMEKYPYSAAFHLTNAGEYEPMIPIGYSLNAGAGVNSIFGTVAGGTGLAFNNHQLAPYASKDLGVGTPVTSMKDLGFNWGLTMSMITATSSLTDRHELNSVNGLSRAHSLSILMLSFGYSQSLYYDENHKLVTDPTGFTTYTFGIGGGLGYRSGISAARILTPSSEPITIQQLPK